jgi:hypothetical protein
MTSVLSGTASVLHGCPIAYLQATVVPEPRGINELQDVHFAYAAEAGTATFAASAFVELSASMSRYPSRGDQQLQLFHRWREFVGRTRHHGRSLSSEGSSPESWVAHRSVPSHMRLDGPSRSVEETSPDEGIKRVKNDRRDRARPGRVGARW